MNFAILKEIIVHLKRKMRCPGCRKRYANRDIRVQGAARDQLDLQIECRKCQTQVVANISLVKEEDLSGEFFDFEQRMHQGIKVTANTLPVVNENDVLDIKNFLTSFEGSFKQLFRSKKSE